MNNRAQLKGIFGFSLILLGFLFIITSFGLIDPLKESLDDARDTTSLNCKGTPNFNQTAYDNRTRLEKLTQGPTCVATGLTMVYFIFTFMIGVVIWVVAKWRKIT